MKNNPPPTPTIERDKEDNTPQCQMQIHFRNKPVAKSKQRTQQVTSNRMTLRPNDADATVFLTKVSTSKLPASRQGTTANAMQHQHQTF